MDRLDRESPTVGATAAASPRKAIARRRAKWLVTFGLCGIALFGTTGIAPVAQAADYYLPIVMPITGFLSVEGGSQRNGATMAIENAPASIKVKTGVYDTGTSATGGATALAKLGTFDLSGCDLYTNGAPCCMCMSSMLWARIARAYYALDMADCNAIGLGDEPFYDELARPLAERRIVPMVQLPTLADEARAAYQLWADKKDKVTF